MAVVGDVTPRRLTITDIVRRLGIGWCALLVLDLAFWLLADFQAFDRPSDGPLSERLHFAGLTACGPFVYILLGLGAFAATTGSVCVLLGVAIVGRNRGFARLVGYFGVGLWFFIGFTFAGMRVT